MQEIVDQALWNEAQAILVFIEDDGTDAFNMLDMLSFESADVIPTLVVEYAGSGPTYGELTGTATISLTPAASLAGAGSLAGSAGMAFSPSGMLAGFGALAGATT